MDKTSSVLSGFKSTNFSQFFIASLKLLISAYKLPNFKYGKEDYKNFEIVFSDNASEDKSWEIACDFEKKNPGKIFLARNRKNY